MSGTGNLWDEPTSDVDEHGIPHRANGSVPPPSAEDVYGVEREAEPDLRPPILIRAGELPRMAYEAESATLNGGLPVYQRGRRLVRPERQSVPASKGRTTIAAGFGEITTPAMIDIMATTAQWQVWDGRKKRTRAANPPHEVASILLSRAGQWRFPVVAGIITTPTMRPDGSLLLGPGYDEATRLFHMQAPDLELGDVGHTRADAERAIAFLDGLLEEFPFVSDVDRSVALSALITPVVRGALPVVPLHAVRASTAGTGKSYLVDVASALVSGRLCPVIAAGRNEEETEKRLVGLLLAGYPLVSIDNIEGDLGGDLLCQAIERPSVRLRGLGKSDIVEIESRATFFATGNSLRVKGDMTRRSIICSLDAGVERPELRQFETDPVMRVLDRRGDYVAAALTVARAYVHAGRPDCRQPLASFAEWSDLVRSALVWLGKPDPTDTIEAAREDDPELSDLREFLNLWHEHIGEADFYTVRELIDLATRRHIDDYGNPSEFALPDMRDLLLRVAGERGAINTRTLAKWMSKREKRIVSGLRIVKDYTTQHGGIIRWKVSSDLKR